MAESPQEFRDRMRSIGYLAGGRSRARVVEGREHPETGRPWKSTEDEGSIVTEHATRDDRVDATAKVTTIYDNLPDMIERRARANRGNPQ